jgi:hypothetical protein
MDMELTLSLSEEQTVKLDELAIVKTLYEQEQTEFATECQNSMRKTALLVSSYFQKQQNSKLRCLNTKHHISL